MKYISIILLAFVFSCQKTESVKKTPVGDALFPSDDFKTKDTSKPRPKPPPKPRGGGGDTIIINPPPPTDTIYEHVIYLDSDGHQTPSGYWRDGLSWYSEPSLMTTAQKAETLSKTQWYYRNFKATVTDNVQIFNAANPVKRQRIVITPTSDWWQGVSGGAFTNSMDFGDDTPAFVFEDRLSRIPSYVGVIAAHEAGHTVGLYHLYDYNDCVLYQQALNKVMGYPFTSSTWWATVPYTSYSCTNYQNDFELLTIKFGLR